MKMNTETMMGARTLADVQGEKLLASSNPAMMSARAASIRAAPTPSRLRSSNFLPALLGPPLGKSFGRQTKRMTRPIAPAGQL